MDRGAANRGQISRNNEPTKPKAYPSLELWIEWYFVE
jgi:hypothetical protein